MGHIMNFAYQGCSSNEERQSLEATVSAIAGQQWMHPQFSMKQASDQHVGAMGMPPVRPQTEAPIQLGTEENHGLPGSSTGNNKVKVKQGNFRAEEDVNLTKWWLAVSTNPITNTGQRREGFWSRITKGYNSTRGRNPQRSLKSLSSRWDHIKEMCSKFGDYNTAILRVNPSGMSDADKTTEALARFAGAQPKPFMLMQCWKLLKDEPKWHTSLGSQSKDNGEDEDCYVTAASNQVESDEVEPSIPSSGSTKRPLGRDSAKARKKAAASSGSGASTEYVSKMHDLWSDRFSFMKEQQVEKSKQVVHLADLEEKKIDQQLDIEERRLALDARRLAKEERVEDARMLAEKERILNIDLEACKPQLLTRPNRRRSLPSTRRHHLDLNMHRLLLAVCAPFMEC